MAEYIELKEIRKTYRPYRQVPVDALRGINLTVKKGEMIAVTGVSGSGKSTLLHIMGFLDQPTGGTIFFEKPISPKMSDRDMAKLRNQKIGFVLQDFALVPYRTAYENIELPLIFSHVPRKERKARIDLLCEKLSIQELMKRKISQMSGGQKQRVAIARALINDPDLILADEPTGALDKKTKHETLDLIQLIHREGKTIVVVTHDPEVAALADRRMVIEDGIISSAENNSSCISIET
ncbi:MAG: ABC transporter ATP-binding protein [Oscillospiraceae bacterium]|nr:ABC transporter ATP-binding protein [Oscillospiraceae bacterium]